jgi:coenzyme F420-reducing hydrogenase gamma subunit
MTDAPARKIRIGWFSFSCCEDNTVIMTEVMNDHWQEWRDLFDFRHVRVLQSRNILDELDIAFIEGAIVSEAQAAEVREIRVRTEKLVAVGSCAVVGMPSAQRNTFLPEQRAEIQFLIDRFGGSPTVRKVADVVAVDVAIPGCPMDPEKFLEAVNALVAELRGVEHP